SRLESQQGVQEATEVQAVLQSRAGEVFRDPDSPVGGNPDGDVTLVEFFDYNCPYCRQVAPLLLEAVAAGPRLPAGLKEFPIHGPNAGVGGKAAPAGEQQGQDPPFSGGVVEGGGVKDGAKGLGGARAGGPGCRRPKGDLEAPAIQGLLDRNLDLARAL